MSEHADQCVCFRPSRVEGIANILEVRISRDFLELVSADGQFRLPLLSFGKGREIGSGRIPIGELHFSKSSYSDSHLVFYASPKITIFMPSDAPTNYPDSHIWRVQEVLRQGGFKLYDEGPPKRAPSVLAPHPIRTLVYILALLICGWLYTLGGFLPEPAGGAWRRFLLSNPHNPSIGLALVLPATIIPVLLAFRHGRTLRTIVAIIAASYAGALLSEWAIRQTIHSWAPLELPPFNMPFGTPQHLVATLLFAVVFALVGWTWRRGFLEPISSHITKPVH